MQELGSRRQVVDARDVQAGAAAAVITSVAVESQPANLKRERT